MGAIHSSQMHSNDHANGGTKQTFPGRAIAEPDPSSDSHISHLIIHSLASFTDDNKNLAMSTSIPMAGRFSPTSDIEADAQQRTPGVTGKLFERLRPLSLFATRQNCHPKSRNPVATAASLLRSYPSVTNELASEADDATEKYRHKFSQHLRAKDVSARYLQSSESSQKIPVDRKASGNIQKFDRGNRDSSGRDSASTSATSILEDKEEEDMHLRRMYDLRTWDMYIRITEARKRKKRHASHSVSNSAIFPQPSNAGVMNCTSSQDRFDGRVDGNGAIPLQSSDFKSHNLIWLVQPQTNHPDLYQAWNNDNNEHEFIFGDIE